MGYGVGAVVGALVFSLLPVCCDALDCTSACSAALGPSGRAEQKRHCRSGTHQATALWAPCELGFEVGAHMACSTHCETRGKARPETYAITAHMRAARDAACATQTQRGDTPDRSAAVLRACVGGFGHAAPFFFTAAARGDHAALFGAEAAAAFGSMGVLASRAHARAFLVGALPTLLLSAAAVVALTLLVWRRLLGRHARAGIVRRAASGWSTLRRRLGAGGGGGVFHSFEAPSSVAGPGVSRPTSRACDEIERSAAKLLGLLDAGIESSAMAAERPTSVGSWAAVGQEQSCALSHLGGAQRHARSGGAAPADGGAALAAAAAAAAHAGGTEAAASRRVLRRRVGAMGGEQTAGSPGADFEL